MHDLISRQPKVAKDICVPNNDCISRQAAIDAILAVTGNSSVRELYEHVQEHGLSDMWSGGVNAAIDIIIAVPSAQPDLCDGCDRYEVSCVGEGCGKLEVPKEEHTEERTETHACEKEKKAMNDDAKFHVHILAEICDYAVQQGMDPDDTVRAVANNLLAMLTICSFNNWGEGEQE